MSEENKGKLKKKQKIIVKAKNNHKIFLSFFLYMV